MPEYLHPGVYVEEIPAGPRPIEGVPTDTAAFLGATERGPIVPQLVTSALEYARRFGDGGCARVPMPFVVRGFFENGGRRLWVCRVVSSTATTAQATVGDYLIAARGPGAWGARLWVKITPGSTRNGEDVPIGFRLRVALFAAGDTPHDCFVEDAPAPRPLLVEDHDYLVTDPRSIDYFAGDSHASECIELRHPQDSPPAAPAAFNGPLAGGTDGASLEAADFARTIAALESQREVALIYAPGADDATQRLLVAHCEAVKFRFAVLDAPAGADPVTLEPRRAIADTAHAAFYAPWLQVAHEDQALLVPPGGHVLGVFARVDLERGVHQAPANEELRGVTGLEFAIDERQQDLLAPRGVNAIRSFAGRGIRVWGARTLASRAEWKYVNVQRLSLFLEHSICQGLQWVLFEPNAEPLWAKVRAQVEQFLLTQWRSGALRGSKPEEAFFVRCDHSVISMADIDLGRLICVVGYAPVRPGEFVQLHIVHRVAAPA
jgi:phage tail sheath protein FI